MTRQISISRRRFLEVSAGAAIGSLMHPLYAAPARYDTIVIGAGLAGLETGTRLRAAGQRVLLLEASKRAGGRVYTLSDVEGAPEAGGTQVGMNYALMRAAGARHGIGFGADTRNPPGTSFFVNGQLFAADQWPTSPANRLPTEFKSVQPGWLMWQWLAKSAPLLENIAWNEGGNLQQDVSLAQFLRELGADEESMRLMEANLNGSSLASLSALGVLHKIAQLRQSRGAESVQGPAQSIPNAMARALGDSLVFAKRVRAVSADDTQVRVVCADGERLVASQCVLALPFPAVRSIELSATLEPAMVSAINEMGYTKVTHVFMRPRSPFWESDQLPPGMWTDTGIGRVFVETDYKGQVRYLRAWIMGPQAESLQGQADAEVASRTIAAIEAARPAARGQLELLRVVSWGNNPLFGGAFSHYQAGQIGAFSQVMGNPQGRLVFAGEQTEDRFSGMEAAFRSGERAAAQILARA